MQHRGSRTLEIGDQLQALREARDAVANDPIRAITEAIANADDANATTIIIRVSEGIIAIHDNGNGINEEDAVFVATNIFRSRTADVPGKKGRFARAMLYQLGCGTSTWCGRQRGLPTIAFTMYHDLSWDEPRRVQDRYITLGADRDRITFTHGTSVIITEVPTDLFNEVKPDRLTGAIMDTFEVDLYRKKFKVGIDWGDNKIQWVSPVTRGAKPVREVTRIKTPYTDPQQPNEAFLFLHPGSTNHVVRVSWRGQTIAADIRQLHPDFRGCLAFNCGMVGGVIEFNEGEPTPDKTAFLLRDKGQFKAWRIHILHHAVPLLNRLVEPYLGEYEERRLGAQRARISRATRLAFEELQEKEGFKILPTGFGGWQAPVRRAGAAGGGLKTKKSPAEPDAIPVTRVKRRGGQTIPYEITEFPTTPGLRQYEDLISYSRLEQDVAVQETYWALYINASHPLYQLAQRNNQALTHLVRCIACELAFINFPDRPERTREAKAALAEHAILSHLRVRR